MFDKLVTYMPAVTGLVLGSILIYHHLVYPFLLSPLAKIPNAHWSSAFSSVWILWTRYQNRELMTINDAHRKLGSIVRLGPKEISVSCYEDGIRTIYGGGFDKPTYFDFFNYYGKPNSFCSLNRNDHTFHRRRMSVVYTKSALFRSSQLRSITEKILLGRLMPKLVGYASTSQPTDILELSYSLCLDLVDCFLFGYSSGSNFLQQEGLTRHFLEHYERRYCKEAFWPQELPRITRLLSRIGITMLPKEYPQSTEYLEQWMMRMCDMADAACSAAEKGELDDAADIPVVYQQVKKAVENDSRHKDFQAKRLELASELFDHMSGAREVLGLVLGYALFYIAQNPSAQHRIRSELLSLSPSIIFSIASTSSAGSNENIGDSHERHNHLPCPSTLDNLPYLSAILKESLRMRPNSTPLPRVTPKDRSVKLAGIEGIPPGTRVNSFQWFVHRDPKKWAHVDQWMPERWLHTESKKQMGNESVLWAFGSGPRVCVGSHFAQYVMRYIIALVCSNFQMHVVNDGTFGLHPPGSLDDQLTVRFEPLHNSHVLPS